MAVAVAAAAVDMAAAAAAAVMAVAVATAAVAAIAGDQHLGAGSESWLLLQTIQPLITLKSTPFEALTHVQWLMSTSFSVSVRNPAAQGLPMTMGQIPMESGQCA